MNRGKKYTVKVGYGTMKEVWVRGSVAENSRVEWRAVGEKQWRVGICYDVVMRGPCPFKLTVGSKPPE